MAKNNNKTIIANWKMNGLLAESMQRMKQLRMNALKNPIECNVVVCTPFTLLRDMAEKIPGTNIKLGAQNCHHEQEGAFTGEISARMLNDMTCEYVILGHSERRQYCNEGSEIVRKRTASAIEAGLVAVICIGETMYERDNDLTKIVLREQLLHSVPECGNNSNVIIAYEPVWAIGSGQTPSVEQIAEIHAYIRDIIEQEIPCLTRSARVIYGGSTSARNANELLSIQGVDGLLIGKASLDPNQFWQMIQAAND